jgi:hypothetical protein
MATLRKHWRLVVLLFVAVMGLVTVTWAGEEQTQAPTERLTFTVAPTKSVFLRGEPVFLKAVVRNDSTSEVRLWRLYRISRADWKAEIARGKEPFRPVDLYRVSADRIGPPSATALGPGEETTDYLTLWFQAYGDVPQERALVFSPWGLFRYRITLSVRVGAEYADAPPIALASEGEVQVGWRERHCLTAMVRCAREIVEERPVFVTRENRARLEALIEELGDSSYAKYAKWLWVRSMFHDPRDAEEGFLLRDTTEEGRLALERFARWSKELCVSPEDEDSPLGWDALAARAVQYQGAGRQEEMKETLKELERRIAPLKLHSDWHHWCY